MWCCSGPPDALGTPAASSAASSVRSLKAAEVEVGAASPYAPRSRVLEGLNSPPQLPFVPLAPPL